jgi:hypothetical protein
MMKQYQDLSQEIKLVGMKRRIRGLPMSPAMDDQTKMLGEAIKFQKSLLTSIENTNAYVVQLAERLLIVEGVLK